MQSLFSYVVKFLNIVNPITNEPNLKTRVIKTDVTINSFKLQKLIEPEMVAIPRGSVPDKTDTKSRFNGQAVAAFEMGKYAVTVAQWKAVMGCLPRGNDELSRAHPVMNVNWYDVKNFIIKLNQLTNKTYRLPTELEWEYVARAGSANDYYFHRSDLFHSDRSRDKVNYDKIRTGTMPVGSLPPNPWGLHEMLGNIWEWVEYTKIVGFNPNAIRDDNSNILRGGCWASHESDITLAARVEHSNSECGWNSFGFRLAI